MKIKNIVNNEEIAKKGKKFLKSTTCTVLASIIIVGSGIAYLIAKEESTHEYSSLTFIGYNLHEEEKKAAAEEKEKESRGLLWINEQRAIADQEFAEKKKAEEEENAKSSEAEETSARISVNDESSNESFYDNLVNLRQSYPNFASEITSESDVYELQNYISKFSSISQIDSSIDSREQFEEIIKNYYTSCIKYSVKPELNLLYTNNDYTKNLLKELEEKFYKTVTENSRETTKEFLKWINDHCYFEYKDNKIDFSKQSNAPLLDTISVITMVSYDENIGDIQYLYHNYNTQDMYEDTQEICPQRIVDMGYSLREDSYKDVFLNMDIKSRKLTK